MTIKQYHVLFGFCVFLSSINLSASGAGDSLRHAISAAHAKAMEVYSNGHFVWIETDRAGESVMKRKYEYWARDGKYFRLDIQEITDAVAGNTVSRTIVAPEGYAKLAEKNQQDSAAIYDFGPAETGANWIRGHYFIAMGNRVATVQVADWLEAWKSRSRDLVSFHLERVNSEGARLVFVRKVDDGTKRYTAEMSGDEYRVTRWSYRFENDGNSQWATNAIELAYEDDLDDIPRNMQSENLSNFDEPASFECVLESFDSQPASVEVFAIPWNAYRMANFKTIWTRRIALMLIGFLLLGLFFYFRKKNG